MKYSYFAGVKGGKFFIRSLYQYNQKSFAFLSPGYTPFVLITKPVNDGYHTHQWYWEDSRSHEIKNWYEIRHLVSEDEVLYQKPEQWSPLEEDRWAHRKFLDHHPQNLYKILPQIYEVDMVMNPLLSLGYCSGVGGRDMNWDLRMKRPPMNTDLGYVINQLQTRRNIVAFKEDTYHWVSNFFMDGNLDILNNDGEDAYVDWVTKHINESKRFEKHLKNLLEYYKIEYEMFNLDRDDYCKVFGLSKNIDRSATNNHFCSLPLQFRSKVKTWTENYLKNN